ncbi:hypothetical protein LIER_11039 [Lithospermum erythrorhizon]|uniref:Uncharacterized protein n=1 Tax=Lithospermum erythrorhizon TaxID=34254 RepID=A0AAV3PLJ5_LITER
MMISHSVCSNIQSLSSVNFISCDKVPFFLTKKFSSLSITTTSHPLRTTIIRMGGGPRTFPGGVSKWQWKRMQAKKSRQLLKARLARERQIYEMRKRAELKAALSELERPWEVVEKAPTLFSVKADEQLKVLADRFQKPGGFDMWSEEDGPELFKNDDGLPSARFFPKGVVHSIRPYGKVEGIGDGLDGHHGSRSSLDNKCNDELIDCRGVWSEGGNGSNLREKRSDEMVTDESNDNRLRNNVLKKRRNRKSHSNGSEEMNSREVALDEGNGRNSRQVYSKRDYRMQSSSNGLEEMSSRLVTLDKGNGRRNPRQVYSKRDYRMQSSSNGLEEMSSRLVTLDEGNGRRNPRQVNNKGEYRIQNSSNGSKEMSLKEVALDEGNGRRNRNPRHDYNKRAYRIHNSSNGSKEMSSKEVAWDEGNGRRNPRHIYNKREYGMQNNSNGSDEMSSREMASDEKNGRKNIRQAYNKSEYRMQNNSEKLKGSTKVEVYDLRLERDARYEFRPEI